MSQTTQLQFSLVDKALTMQPRALQAVTLKAKDACNIDFRFAPETRMTPFSQEVYLEIFGQRRRLLVVSGACLGVGMKLDADKLPFGSVIQGSTLTKRIKLSNVGDIGSKFAWYVSVFDWLNCRFCAFGCFTCSQIGCLSRRSYNQGVCCFVASASVIFVSGVVLALSVDISVLCRFSNAVVALFDRKALGLFCSLAFPLCFYLFGLHLVLQGPLVQAALQHHAVRGLRSRARLGHSRRHLPPDHSQRHHQGGACALPCRWSVLFSFCLCSSVFGLFCISFVHAHTGMQMEGMFLTLSGACIPHPSEAALSLVFHTQVRKAVTQSITLSNDTSTRWLLRPLIKNDAWSGEPTVEVPANGASVVCLCCVTIIFLSIVVLVFAVIRVLFVGWSSLFLCVHHFHHCRAVLPL